MLLTGSGEALTTTRVDALAAWASRASAPATSAPTAAPMLAESPATTAPMAAAPRGRITVWMASHTLSR